MLRQEDHPWALDVLGQQLVGLRDHGGELLPQVRRVAQVPEATCPPHAHVRRALLDVRVAAVHAPVQLVLITARVLAQKDTQHHPIGQRKEHKVQSSTQRHAHRRRGAREPSLVVGLKRMHVLGRLPAVHAAAVVVALVALVLVLLALVHLDLIEAVLRFLLQPLLLQA